MERLAAFSCRVELSTPLDADRLALGRDAGASLESSKRSKGRWTKEEHEHFLIGLRERGKDWDAIQRDFVPTRSVTQIRTHAQKFFRKTDQGLPFPYEPYISTGKSLAVYKPNPVSVDGDTAATTSTTGDTAADAVGAHASAAAATAFPPPDPHPLGFKHEKGTNDAVPNVLPQAPQETLCSLPPLGLQSDLINHLTGMMYEDANNLGELANIQRLGEEWIGGSVDKDGDRGGVAGVSSAPAWSGPWAPSNFTIDGGGSSHHSAASFGRDEDSTGARLVPHSSESVLGIQEQQQQYLQHQQLPSVSWQGYAPGDSAGGGRSGSANY